ncbi:MAG: 3-phosphoshikimate 1-carboxyvinyltransferase [Candidatus Lokiarchaeota archaeon]|nr:3-phosphoshikimate 1-carboxyvinyltransferase [Candidatus Lokiarchaeota archaeon]
MNLIINIAPNALNGEIIPPGSKSHSHRALILAGFAQGASIINNPLIFGDVDVTINILKTLGIKIAEIKKGSYVISGRKDFFLKQMPPLDCKNSGTTLRILTALSLLIEGGLKFKGIFLERERPILPLLDALKNLGAEYKLEENTLHIKRKKDIYIPINIKGDISSQFITALLILCPLIKCKDTNVIYLNITTPLVSYPYVEITLNILKTFGINIIEKRESNNLISYIIETGQILRTQLYDIPSDFSSAAVIIAAVILCPLDSKVEFKNLNFQDPQGDKRFINILQDMGAKIDVFEEKKKIIVYGNINKNPLKGIKIDLNDIPDLFPILSVIGTFAQGETILVNAHNLRFKECDRISIMARELQKKGVKVIEKDDGMIVYHCNDLKGSEIDHEKDHRIAMANIVASLYANSESTIKNIEIIKDSYPNFIEDLEKLGANIKKIR